MNPNYSPFIRSAQDRLSTAIQSLDHERGLELIGDDKFVVGINFRSPVADHDTKLTQAELCPAHPEGGSERPLSTLAVAR